MKSSFYLFILLSTLCLLACFTNNRKSKPEDNLKQIRDTSLIDNSNYQSLESVNNRFVDTNSTVIFSTENLGILGNDEVEKELKCYDYDNKIITHEFYTFYLPGFDKYKVVVMYDDYSDSPLYLLSIVHQGAIYYNESLNIIPESSTPDFDDGVYEIKKFEIYSDQTIKIYTEKSDDGQNVEKYTKFYRLNDKGKFYELSK